MALSALNKSDHTFGFAVVRHEALGNLKLRQGVNEVAGNPVISEPFGKMRFAQIRLEAQCLADLGVSTRSKLLTRPSKSVNQAKGGSELGMGEREIGVKN